MAKRVGIELSPLTCRIVELDGDVPETSVRGYAIVPAGSEEMSSKLASLRRVEAAVVVWGVPSDHRQVVVGERNYEDMRAEAIAAVRQAGVQTEGMTADIARAGAVAGGRQPVVLTLADSQDLSAAVSPLVEAGIRVQSVVTSAVALTSLARTRRAFTAPGSIEAYVALEEAATAVALVRDGVLLSACELPWGYLETDHTTPRRRDDVALQLADDLQAFFSTVGAAPGAVRQLLICGGLSELRSMTVPLMERLDLEVETLDSLLGIDETRLPEPAEEFRERAAELRLAWAVAADRVAPINLMRPRRRLTARSWVARAATAAGIVVGLGLGWRIEQSQWLDSIMNPPPRSAPKSVERVTPSPSTAPSSNRETPPAPAPAQASARPPVSAPPIGSPAQRLAPSPAPAPVTSLPVPSPPRVAAPTPASPRPPALPPAPSIERPSTPVVSQPASPQGLVPPSRASVAVEAPLVIAPPARTSAAVEAPRVASPPARPVQQPTPPAVQSGRVIETPAPPPSTSAASIQRPAPPPPVRTAAVREATPLPFDAALVTILYSSDRQLAIIDGRIVGAGDEVKGARIVEITPNSVLLRDAQGRLRSLTLGATGR